MAKLKGKSRDEVTRSRSWSLRSLCRWRYGAALRPIKIVLESVNRGQLISKKRPLQALQQQTNKKLF